MDGCYGLVQRFMLPGLKFPSLSVCLPVCVCVSANIKYRKGSLCLKTVKHTPTYTHLLPVYLVEIQMLMFSVKDIFLKSSYTYIHKHLFQKNKKRSETDSSTVYLNDTIWTKLAYLSTILDTNDLIHLIMDFWFALN